MSAFDPNDRLVAAYRRERLSFLQYVRQSSPYAGPADRPLLERVRELGAAEAAGLDRFAEYLDANRVSVAYLGAFPSVFTNFNFVAVRNLIPHLIADQRRGLAAIQADAAALPDGEARARVERLIETKRVHLTELEKLGEPASGVA